MQTKSTSAWLALGFVATALSCFGWILFSGQQIGNDYQAYQVSQAMNLRYFQKLGVEPQWHAYITGGIPIHGLALTQAFYLPGWLTSLLPGYWTGRALDWFSLRHLCLAMGGHFLFFILLRKFFSTTRLLAFLFSLVCFYQLRTLDSLRFGNAMDATVLAYGIVVAFALYTLKPSPKIGILIFLLTQLLFTASYIVIVPYIVLGSVFVVFAVLATSENFSSTFRHVLGSLGFSVLGFLAAAPNWVPFTEWLLVNAHRVKAPSLEWADFVPMSGQSLKANIWFPWAAEVHSGFAGSTLLILVLGTIALLGLFYIRHTWFFLIGLALPFFYAVGSRSPLYLFFFNYVPGFASIRVPGRIFSILPLVVFSLALVLWTLAKKDPEKFRSRLLVSGLTASVVVLVGSLLAVYRVLFFGQGSGFGDSLQDLTPERLNSFWNTTTKLIWLILALISTTAFARILFFRCKTGPFLLSLGVASLLQTTLLMNYGTWRSDRIETPTFAAYEAANKLPLQGAAPLIAGNELYESTFGTATVPYTEYIKNLGPAAHCFLPIEMGKIEIPNELPFYFPERLVCVDSRSSAWNVMSRTNCVVGSKPIAVVIDPAKCQNTSAKVTAARVQNAANRIVTLTPNRVVFATDTISDSYFATPFPAVTANWTVRINREIVPQILINGGFIGIFVPAGKNLIEISYFSPWIVLALRLAALALAGVSLVLLFGKFSSRRASIAAMILTLLAVPAYFSYEKRYLSDARRDILLNHDYQERLTRQLSRWGK